MKYRIGRHVLFWSAYVFLYAFLQIFFAGPSDMVYSPLLRFFRFCLLELLTLPWKVIPFYVIFYKLIPTYGQLEGNGFSGRNWLALIFWTFLVLFVSILGYRFMIKPARWILYREVPDFQVFQFNRLLYTFTEILPAIALAGTVKLLNGRFHAQKRERALELEKTKNELRFLKAQTNPHFLFNTLNNLYGLARRQDEHTADSILKLAQIMRFILHECDRDRISIQQEWDIIQSYIELEQLRYHNRLTVRTSIELADSNHSIAPLLLLPFVENAFKHVSAEVSTEAFIEIALRVQDRKLQFRVQNSRFEKLISVSGQYGLKNIRRQLELTYPQASDLDIVVRPDHFSIHLEIQF